MSARRIILTVLEDASTRQRIVQDHAGLTREEAVRYLRDAAEQLEQAEAGAE